MGMGQGLHRPGLIEPDKGIELLGHDGLEIMAVEFGIRPVDHPNGTLQAWTGQRSDEIGLGCFLTDWRENVQADLSEP